MPSDKDTHVLAAIPRLLDDSRILTVYRHGFRESTISQAASTTGRQLLAGCAEQPGACRRPKGAAPHLVGFNRSPRGVVLHAAQIFVASGGRNCLLSSRPPAAGQTLRTIAERRPVTALLGKTFLTALYSRFSSMRLKQPDLRKRWV